MRRRTLQSALSRLRIVGEFLRFLWQQKLYWLIAVALVLLLLALLAFLSATTPLGPWIYPLL